MWNYGSMPLCTLVVCTLLAFYLAKPKLPLRSCYSFLCAMLSLLVLCTVASTASMVGGISAGGAVAFFTLLSLHACFTCMFMLDASHEYRMRKSAWSYAAMALPVIVLFALLQPFALGGSIMSLSNGVIYQEALFPIVYILPMLYLVMPVPSVLSSTELTPMKKTSLIGGIILSLCGLSCIPLYDSPFVVCAVSSISLLAAYISTMNPDLLYSERVGAFNKHGLRSMLSDPDGGERALVGVAIRNYSYERSVIGGAGADDLVSDVCTFLCGLDAYVFYLRNGRFALLLDGCADMEPVKDAISERFSRPWDANGLSVMLYPSFAMGCIGSEHGAKAVDDLMVALDTDSPSGGDDIRAANRRMEMLRNVEEAITSDGFEVFLQPIMDGKTRELVAAEALVRIRDVDGSLVPPCEFISIAEKSGHIDELGEAVLRKTCAFIRGNDTDAMGMKWINVNLSPVQCLQEDLHSHIAAVLDEYGVPADKIHLEVTEEAMIDKRVMVAQIDRLREHGLQIVLDDYGTGYSNLSRIRRYPFSNIKIDIEVVSDYFETRDDILPALIGGFRELGLAVTAEGIETEEMAEALSEIGCDMLQGYLYSKPIPMEEFAEKYGCKEE